jgi:hypothetical protein
LVSGIHGLWGGALWWTSRQNGSSSSRLSIQSMDRSVMMSVVQIDATTGLGLLPWPPPHPQHC